EHVPAEGGDGDDAESLAAREVARGEALLHGIEVLERVPAPVAEELAAGGERHASPGPREELDADGPLERADLVADGGLGEMEVLARASEAALLADGQEGREVADLLAKLIHWFDRFYRIITFVDV